MKSFRNYLAASALVMGFLFFYIPFRYQTPYPREVGPELDKNLRATYINALNEQQPEILLLGDSMLAQAVDERVVQDQLGKKTMLVSLPGTASTIWYLMTKNNIVLAEHKPKYLAIFFRDSMMTVPGYRVNGRYFEQIDEFATPSDTLLIQRAYVDQMNPLERFMERYVPLYGSRWTIRRSIDYHIRYLPAKSLLHCDPECTDNSMNSVFSGHDLDIGFLSEAIAASDNYIYTDKALNFEQQIDGSFLPEIIRLCKENGIQLVLVRVPINRFIQPGTKPERLDSYLQELDTYLNENKIAYFDFGQNEFPSQYFEDDVHLNEQGKVIFTQWLVKALRTVVK